jgi:hypothetical protein
MFLLSFGSRQRHEPMQSGTKPTVQVPKPAIISTPASDKAALEAATRGDRTRRKTTELDKIRKFPELGTVQDPSNRSDGGDDNPTGFQLSTGTSAVDKSDVAEMMDIHPERSKTLREHPKLSDNTHTNQQGFVNLLGDPIVEDSGIREENKIQPQQSKTVQEEPQKQSHCVNDNPAVSSGDSALENSGPDKQMDGDPMKFGTGERSRGTKEDDDSVIATVITQVKLSGKTVRLKLKSCLRAMRKEHRDKVVASGHFSKSMTTIQKFVKSVIKSKGRSAGPSNPPILYICGAPGTGKTMSTTQICNESIESAIHNKEEWEESPRVCYLNCSHLQGFSKRDALEKVFEYMDVSTRKLHRSSSDDAPNFAMILILDEIDVLVGNAGTEGCLKTLLSWASDENKLLSVIGISNSINDKKSHRLFELGMVS